MNRQEFHGSVGQVAGRDIINEAPETFWDWDSVQLQREYERSRTKLWQLRRDIYLNVPFFWIIAGVLGSAWLLLSGMWFKIAGQIWMFAWLVGAQFIPMLWLTAIRQRKGKMIALYRKRIEIIDTILQDGVVA